MKSSDSIEVEKVLRSEIDLNSSLIQINELRHLSGVLYLDRLMEGVKKVIFEDEDNILHRGPFPVSYTHLTLPTTPYV